jgi:hypothetical protein
MELLMEVTEMRDMLHVPFRSVAGAIAEGKNSAVMLLK